MVCNEMTLAMRSDRSAGTKQLRVPLRRQARAHIRNTTKRTTRQIANCHMCSYVSTAKIHFTQMLQMQQSIPLLFFNKERKERISKYL